MANGVRREHLVRAIFPVLGKAGMAEERDPRSKEGKYFELQHGRIRERLSIQDICSESLLWMMGIESVERPVGENSKGGRATVRRKWILAQNL
ncbi:hypothetical protein L484_024011 [Morus notabilis]|uniref:Uncharacterized protein n=1 Tax=Morus notabilis TaxID=981085 RepID=W9R0J5_9ROSA|nr:hypothetical protein L484_024011 [Morus notabilis]